MISDRDRLESQQEARRRGLEPGLEVLFVDYLDNRSHVGTLWTVPGFDDSRGPYCRVKKHLSFEVAMILPRHITSLGLDTSDQYAVEQFLERTI